MTTIKFRYTGLNQTFTVPSGVYYITIKVWGAGGGYSGFGKSGSGCGGYSTGGLSVSPGQVLNIMVGGKGSGASTVATYGGGGAGGNSPLNIASGSSGGGRSGVAFSGQSQFIIAGGGGGGSNNNTFKVEMSSGNGGGIVGTSLLLTTTYVFPTPVTLPTSGTQTAGGSGGINLYPANWGSDGSSLVGGAGGQDFLDGGGGAGGGGGYFGGGGGTAGLKASGTDETGAGGGSGYINTAILSATTATTTATPTATPTATTFGVVLPPNTTDPDYITGVGVGGNTGGDGLVVITYSTIAFTKTVNKTSAGIGDIVTYNIYYNGGSAINTNAYFVDTIPTNTSFVTDSVYVNSVRQLGANPNPPGVSLGTIGPSNTTITFSVKVTNVPPSPYTIPNSSSIYADNLPIVNSNSVNTTILAAALSSSKTVSKVNATIGDILTYTIPIANVGNTTAINILFIDTIPNGTSLVAGSFKQDSTAIATSPNPPGTNLPSSIGVGKTSTVTFQVRLTNIPSTNPISNIATLNYSYLVAGTTIANQTSTNNVNTTIKYASISGITKSVDKSFATCGDVITYTILAPNSGNVTAQNVIFKDTIPNGTTFVTDSVYINGNQSIGSNPNTGFTVPNIAPSSTTTIVFSVKVPC